MFPKKVLTLPVVKIPNAQKINKLQWNQINLAAVTPRQKFKLSIPALRPFSRYTGFKDTSASLVTFLTPPNRVHVMGQAALLLQHRLFFVVIHAWRKQGESFTKTDAICPLSSYCWQCQQGRSRTVQGYRPKYNIQGHGSCSNHLNSKAAFKTNILHSADCQTCLVERLFISIRQYYYFHPKLNWIHDCECWDD